MLFIKETCSQFIFLSTKSKKMFMHAFLIQSIESTVLQCEKLTDIFEHLD